MRRFTIRTGMLAAVLLVLAMFAIVVAAEKSQRISQVNSAVTQLDRMTQQNAALVEQSAATAESLRE